MLRIAAGAALAAAGPAICIAAARELGGGLTPFPRPSRGGALAERGPYRVVRHPFYTGGALCIAGLSLAFSPGALVLTALLVVVWALKARVEERFLMATYPEYGSYRERTRFRLVPFVY